MLFLERLGLDNELLWRLEHAAGEAIAASVEQGSRECTYFELRVRLIGSALRIEVEDDGLGFDFAAGRTSAEATRGFGIHMMRTLVDGVAFFKNGRTVRLETWLSQSQMQALRGSQRREAIGS